MKRTTIWLSIETYDKLNSLKKVYEELFNTSISFDKLISSLLIAKVDLVSELAMLGKNHE